MRHGATFSSTLRFSTIASGGTRPWAISARPSSRSLPWRHELTMVSAIPGEDHFLKGVIVRAVWCELEKGSGGWARTRLLLSTDPALSAPAIVEDYSKRWSIEPLFRDLKVVDGLGALWQRGRSTLLRWLHLIQIARALLVLLTARADPEVLALIRRGGWRPATTLTPGLVKDALACRFRYFEPFPLSPETRQKSGPVRSPGPPPSAAVA